MNFTTDKSGALELDNSDPLRGYRSQFYFPQMKEGGDCIYLCGNSLGLQPKRAKEYVLGMLKDWERCGVRGHFFGDAPWTEYNSLLKESVARLVGAKKDEVVVMNTLTVNIHLMMCTFYRPTSERYKILRAEHAFPSDRYAQITQVEFHGLDPEEAIIEAPIDKIGEYIEEHGESIALILIDGLNYYSGELVDLKAVVQGGHRKGCYVGFDLAHGIGNVPFSLHEWGVDFAAWCSYKYLNGGPGCLSGCFIHEKHSSKERGSELPRLGGWWGSSMEERFLMGPEFVPAKGADGWQLSNPPILPLAALRASLEIFDRVGIDELRKKSKRLTGYLHFLLDELCHDTVTVLTPVDPEKRGCQLSLKVKGGKKIFEKISECGVICDWREPDVIRVAPVPLYNSFSDVFRFVEILKKSL